MKSFVQQLRQYIKDNDLDQKDVAEIVGTYPANVSRVLNDKEQLSFERAEKWAKCLGLRLKVELEKI